MKSEREDEKDQQMNETAGHSALARVATSPLRDVAASCKERAAGVREMRIVAVERPPVGGTHTSDKNRSWFSSRRGDVDDRPR